jgi:hypothetical protein
MIRVTVVDLSGARPDTTLEGDFIVMSVQSAHGGERTRAELMAGDFNLSEVLDALAGLLLQLRQYFTPEVPIVFYVASLLAAAQHLAEVSRPEAPNGKVFHPHAGGNN